MVEEKAEIEDEWKKICADVASGPTPKRVQITKELVNKFGGTSGCLKCSGGVAGEKSYQLVHHSTGVQGTYGRADAAG